MYDTKKKHNYDIPYCPDGAPGTVENSVKSQQLLKNSLMIG
jgi:hypothetical protein